MSKIINYYKNKKYVYFTFDKIATHLNADGIEKKHTVFTYKEGGKNYEMPKWKYGAIVVIVRV